MKRFEAAALLLKRVPRRGWVEAGIKRPESVAAHSYGLAALAMVYADLMGLDAEKAVKMAVLHDLAEAYIGDLTPRSKSRIRKNILEAVERAVVRQLLADLPRSMAENYEGLYDEFLYKRSAEARLVHRLDRRELFNEASLLMLEQGLRVERFGLKKAKAFRNIVGRDLDG
jgi:putative hydrolase of HD superfamily